MFVLFDVTILCYSHISLHDTTFPSELSHLSLTVVMILCLFGVRFAQNLECLWGHEVIRCVCENETH